MDATILEYDKKNQKASFLLKGASPAYANMIRRFVIESVPTMAIEDIEFRKNSVWYIIARAVVSSGLPKSRLSYTPQFV